MDQITLNRIQTLHPKIRTEVLNLYRRANNLELGKGVRLRFSYTFRTPEEQDNLFSQGRTRPGKRVTNAKAWQSIHNYGLAFDIVLLYDNDNNGTFEEASWDTKRDGDKDGIPDWLEVTKIFTQAGYTNGFITNGRRWDLPHFQKDFGYTWRRLKTKIDKGDYITETINGVSYKYPNL
jgi:peptidoglycan L-alanyl-D-glutamate endopeptidase CwlK